MKRAQMMADKKNNLAVFIDSYSDFLSRSFCSRFDWWMIRKPDVDSRIFTPSLNSEIPEERGCVL